MDMSGIIGPIPENFSTYVTRVGGGLELIPAPLYDTQTYTSATTRTLTYFSLGVQNGRYDVTNMPTGGQLPNPQSFLIEYPRLFFKTTPQSTDSGVGGGAAVTGAFSDVVNLTNSGIVTILIDSKKYGPWPMWMWTTNSFVKGAFATGSDLLANYGQLDGNLYPFLPKLALLPLQPFSVVMEWPGGPVTTSTGTVDIQVCFDGKLARAI